MRLVTALALGLLFSLKALSQSPDTFDLLDYQMPAGNWKKNTSNDFVSYTLEDKQKGYCILAIYKSTTSTGSPEADGQADWNEFGIKRYPDITDSKPSSQAVEGSQWVQVQNAGTVLKNNLSILVSVITFSGYGKRLTILFENTDTSFDQYLVAFSSSMAIHPVESFQPLESSQTAVAVPAPDVTPSKAKPASFLGKWQRSISSYANAVTGYYPITQGYTKYHYDFKEDHTYTFYLEQCSINMACMFFQNEHGTYTAEGNQLILMPIQSVFEKRGYKDGRTVPGGPLLNTENLPLKLVTYTWSFYYWSGTDEWTLALQTAQPTQRDGDFNTVGALPNCYHYKAEK